MCAHTRAACMYTCACTQTDTHTHTHTGMHVCTHKCTHAHTHTHTCMYAHTHTHKQTYTQRHTHTLSKRTRQRQVMRCWDMFCNRAASTLCVCWDLWWDRRPSTRSSRSISWRRPTSSMGSSWTTSPNSLWEFLLSGVHSCGWMLLFSFWLLCY